MKKGIAATCRQQRSNPNSRNFGLLSRDMDKAAKNAMQEKFNAKQVGFSSVDRQSSRFRQFSVFVRESYGIKDMRNLTREHVMQYANTLIHRIDNGDLSAKSAHDYLAAVNSVLSQAIGNDSLKYTASQAGFPTRSGIATVNKAISQSMHDNIKAQLPERERVISEIQRCLGLRFEEASKCNPRAMYQQAITQSFVSITEGTKGGQARIVPIVSQQQIDALKHASVIQGQHRSLIPKELSYAEYQSQAYREYAKLGYQTHSERHAYAQQSYTRYMERLTAVAGIKSPIQSGCKHGAPHHQYIAQTIGCSVIQAKHWDQTARQYVAEELGHHRIEITNSYLG